MDDEMHQAVSSLSGDGIAGVDHQQMAIDAGGGIGTQKRDRRGDFLLPQQPPARHVFEPKLHHVRSRTPDLREHVGIGITRAYGVHTNAVPSPFDAEYTRHMRDTGLRNIIANMLLRPYDLYACNRGCEHNHAASTVQHWARKRAGAVEA